MGCGLIAGARFEEGTGAGPVVEALVMDGDAANAGDAGGSGIEAGETDTGGCCTAILAFGPAAGNGAEVVARSRVEGPDMFRTGSRATLCAVVGSGPSEGLGLSIGFELVKPVGARFGPTGGGGPFDAVGELAEAETNDSSSEISAPSPLSIGGAIAYKAV